MPDRYRRLVFQVEAEGLELLSASLWEQGTLGIEQLDGAGPASVAAYFVPGVALTPDDWRDSGARLVATEECEEHDWMEAYREHARPLPVGRRLIVDPREPHPAAAQENADARESDRWTLRLPARTAFGTGSHPSTRLVIEILDDLDLEGARALDVGAGSGILSFATLLFGAARVVGVEIDLEAALVGAQNRRLNRLAPDLVAGGLDALAPASHFDLALVNVLPERIAAELGVIRRLLVVGGLAIFSGVLTESADEVERRLTESGFAPVRRRSMEEWSALLVEAAGE